MGFVKVAGRSRGKTKISCPSGSKTSLAPTGHDHRERAHHRVAYGAGYRVDRASGSIVRALSFALAVVALAATAAPAAPVVGTHPRLLLSATEKTRLLAKKNAGDPSWQALKARADALATYTINPYKFATSSAAPPLTIYYTYQGEGWLAAALPLAFAYQMTGDTTYSSKLVELAQEMIRAQSDPDNNPPIGQPPIQLDSYYASRTVAATLAFIYDYCYDQLSPALKAQMVTLMNQYFDDVRVNGYQAQNFSNAADGNYFGGHLYGVALMGYASSGDNPRAQEMIEWARIRFDGTPGAVPPPSIPAAWRSQVFDGGLRPAAALDFNGPAVTGNPFKGGFDFQGWSYGSEEFSRMIDYMLTVRSATGEDVLTPHAGWFPQILRAEKQALFPNRFMIDPTGDWGGFQGAVISQGLPKRLAFVLAGTADGPGAQHFAEAEIAVSTISGAAVFPAEEWAEFFFADPARPSTELVLPPYHTGFAPSYPQGASSPGGTNGAIPYFVMRSDWGMNATWASVQMGSQWWDDHQHYAAGHLVVARGSDYLLVSASDWKTATDPGGNPIHGGPGILGGSLEANESSLANTLYFDDFGDFQSTDELASGGQYAVGVDQVVADELNQDFSYVRSDLSTAYNRAGDPADTPNRKLEFFYRNFLYLRAPNVFVVYDQVKATLSSNPRGAYRKHIRWHVPEAPVITGKTARMDHGQSRLFLDALLPVNATLTVVDELANPDPCDGSEGACVPFGQANAGTLRIEVRDPLNPLFVPFLAVLQPGSNTSTAPTNTLTASIDGKMIGVVIEQSGGARSIALFNNQGGQVPPPITSTSYAFPGSGLVTHVLTGLVPNAAYAVALNNGIVSVDQNPTGNRTASPSGVLHFQLSTVPATLPAVTTGSATSVTPNSAVLNGTVNPNGFPTTGHFEYGRNLSYGNTTASQSLGAGTSAVPLGGGALSGLGCGTYHFRAVGVNTAGTAYGLDATFTTTTCPARVFVSVSGSDSNDCSVQTTPCRNLAGALGQVAVDGEVIVLAPGEYETAPLTITKAVKITSPSGTVAFVRWPLTVNAPGARVVLRGLTLKGAGTGNGVTLSAADALSIESSSIDGWNIGLKLDNAIASQVTISGSVFRANLSGVSDNGGGAGNRASVEDTRFEGNTTGIDIVAGTFAVRDCAFVGNSGSGLRVGPGSAGIRRVEFSHNGAGVTALSGGTVRIGRSLVFGNTTGWSAAAGSMFISTGGNGLRGNGTDSVGAITTSPEG